jgi:large subunit ribosomal protein L9
MDVILREDIAKLGARGEMVKVADGYARNYLIPQRLAVPASPGNKKIVELERQAHLRREAKEKAGAEDLAKMMSGLSVTIAQKAGELDQLFGSVTAKDIAEALEKQNYHIDRRKIHLPDPIKQLGEHKVTIRLHREVPLEVTVQVVKED